jgi:hypothetical protein
MNVFRVEDNRPRHAKTFFLAHGDLVIFFFRNGWNSGLCIDLASFTQIHLIWSAGRLASNDRSLQPSDKPMDQYIRLDLSDVAATWTCKCCNYARMSGSYLGLHTVTRTDLHAMHGTPSLAFSALHCAWPRDRKAYSYLEDHTDVRAEQIDGFSASKRMAYASIQGIEDCTESIPYVQPKYVYQVQTRQDSSKLRYGSS